MYSVSILVRSNGFNSLCVHYKGARINRFLFPEEIWGQKVKGVNTFHEFKKVRKFQGSDSSTPVRVDAGTCKYTVWPTIRKAVPNTCFTCFVKLFDSYTFRLQGVTFLCALI